MSFAGDVREILQAAKEPIPTDRIAEKLGIPPGERRTLNSAIANMRERGEVVSAEKGHSYVGNPNPNPPNKNEVMWSLLRSRKSVTKHDLMELAEASEYHARSFLRTVVKNKYAKKTGKPGMLATYHLANDPGPNGMPQNENARKLRQLRKAKKELKDAMDSMMALAAETKHLVGQIPD